MSYDKETGFQINNVDVGKNLVSKEYLIDAYPNLADQFRTAGLYSVGDNTAGALGQNLNPNVTPDTTTFGQVAAYDTSWVDISTSLYVGAAIRKDGRLWLWGNNQNGQLGDNTRTDRSSPVQTVSAGINWKQVRVTTYGHTAAIKTDNSLWVWGINNVGQLGTNNRTHRSSPVQTVSAGTNWSKVAIGSDSFGGGHTAAIKTDGTLWTWGYNIGGQLGDNTSTDRSSPVQTISGGTDWVKIACGALHTAAIKTDNTLWMWGYNNQGQLGDGTTTDKSSPVQTVAGGTNWKQVACGGRHTAAIKTDGTLWIWGSNVDGRLGDNTVISRSSPVQTISGGTNWAKLSDTFWSTTSAIKSDGTLWTWGLGTSGQLGNGAISLRSSPVQTTLGGNAWKNVSISNTLLAIRDETEDLI